MVPFAGWSMPSVYEDLSSIQSVTHTRSSLSMFDVSHMLQVLVTIWITKPSITNFIKTVGNGSELRLDLCLF